MYSNLARRLFFSASVFCFGIQLAFAGQPPEKDPAAAVVSPEQLQAIKTQIARLNATDNLEREDAEQQLLKMGPVALPLIKEAQKAPDPETAARAKRLLGKMTAAANQPTESYAEILPANSVFFLEAPHTRQSLDRWKECPLGKFWDLPAMQKFYVGHREAQVPNDQKILDAVREIPKLLDGKALFALGGPDTAEAAELDPPLVYVVESKQGAALEAAVRKLFDGMTDVPKGSRRYGPFNVEEHITAQSVFGQDSIIHSLTQKGIESFIDGLLKRPEKSLNPELKEIRALLPQHDFVYRISADNFKDLADNGQLIDDQQLEVLETLGFLPGSSWTGAIAATPDGFEDVFRLVIGGGEKNDGIVAVLSRMAATMPPAPAAGAPQSLDLIPWQAGLLVSFNGDTAKNAAALSRALKNLDVIFAAQPVPAAAPAQPGKAPVPGQPPQPMQPGVFPGKGVPPPNPLAPKPGVPPAPPPAGAPKPDAGARNAPAPATPAAQPAQPAQAAPGTKPANTLGQQALAAAGGTGAQAPAAAPEAIAPAPGGAQVPPALPAGAPAAGAKKDPVAPGDPKPAPRERKERVPPHISRFEKLGLKLEQFLEQVEGPVQVGLFMQQIEDETPDEIPISPLLAVLLKDPKVIEQSLEAASAGPTPRFDKEVLNGGVHYVEKGGNPDTKPGFWLKDNYLAWSSERDLLDLAGAALLHKGGTERMADRASYKAALAAKRIDPAAVFTFFGDAEQVIEMPYKLAKVNWQEDDANPWPAWDLVKALLKDKPVMLEFKSIPNGLQVHGITPLSLMGMIEAFRRNLIEAGFW
jgi:hypothetical protein